MPAFPQPTTTDSATACGFLFNGQFSPCKSGREVLITIFERFSQEDPDFLPRFALLPRHGRSSRYLARTPAALFPNRSDYLEHRQLSSGWYLHVHHSHTSIMKIIEMACQVMNLKYGEDIQAFLK